MIYGLLFAIFETLNDVELHKQVFENCLNVL